MVEYRLKDPSHWMRFNVPQHPQFLEKWVCKIVIIKNYQIPLTFRHISFSVELIAAIKPGFNRTDMLPHFFSPLKLFPVNTQSRMADHFQNRYIFPKHYLKKIQGNQLKEDSSKHKIHFKKNYWIVVETKFLLKNLKNPLHTGNRVTVYIIYV